MKRARGMTTGNHFFLSSGFSHSYYTAADSHEGLRCAQDVRRSPDTEVTYIYVYFWCYCNYLFVPVLQQLLDTVQQQQLYLHQLSDLRTAASHPLPQRSVLPQRTTSNTKEQRLCQQPARRSLINHYNYENNVHWSYCERVVSPLTPRFMSVSLVHQKRTSRFQNINPPGRDPSNTTILKNRSPLHHFVLTIFFNYFRHMCFCQARSEYVK